VNRSVLSRRLVVGVVGVALAALAVAGCSNSSDNNNPAPGGSSAPANDFASLSGTIKGSGSSFANNLYQAAIDKFADVAPDVDVSYNSVGSGQGKKDFGSNLTDFAGTDSLVKPAGADGPADGSFYYIPVAAAPITLSFNLNGVDKIKLSGPTIAKIFTLKITNWNDPAITADNGTALPAGKITVVHRSDGSGTTNNFSKYLAAVDPTDFTLTPGDTVKWPDGTVGAEKNGGVAQAITQTAGAIGYVDFADASAAKLKWASVKNKDGNFTDATLAGASAALAGATPTAELTINPLNTAGADVYPITQPTYMLVRPSYTDAAKGKAVKGFVKWLLTDGQALYESKFYAKLPASLAQAAIAKIDSVTA
jgi:phosphate transport system substrate-binding protein